mmetsp:Transcript_9963/g.9872  ORF Transcript_9963/g.9872 Transcript_9963/m.9872 type:complete len:248 (-) Transcript_9963:1850-2593(-)
MACEELHYFGADGELDDAGGVIQHDLFVLGSVRDRRGHLQLPQHRQHHLHLRLHLGDGSQDHRSRPLQVRQRNDEHPGWGGGGPVAGGADLGLWGWGHFCLPLSADLQDLPCDQDHPPAAEHEGDDCDPECAPELAELADVPVHPGLPHALHLRPHRHADLWRPDVLRGERRRRPRRPPPELQLLLLVLPDLLPALHPRKLANRPRRHPQVPRQQRPHNDLSYCVDDGGEHDLAELAHGDHAGLVGH